MFKEFKTKIKFEEACFERLFENFFQVSNYFYLISAAPRFEIPEIYVDGLIFRHEEIIRLKIPMIAKPTPKVCTDGHTN